MICVLACILYTRVERAQFVSFSFRWWCSRYGNAKNKNRTPKTQTQRHTHTHTHTHKRIRSNVLNSIGIQIISHCVHMNESNKGSKIFEKIIWKKCRTVPRSISIISTVYRIDGCRANITKNSLVLSSFQQQMWCAIELNSRRKRAMNKVRQEALNERMLCVCVCVCVKTIPFAKRWLLLLFAQKPK